MPLYADKTPALPSVADLRTSAAHKYRCRHTTEETCLKADVTSHGTNRQKLLFLTTMPDFSHIKHENGTVEPTAAPGIHSSFGSLRL